MSPLQSSRPHEEIQRESSQQPRIRCKLPVDLSPFHRDVVSAFFEAFVDAFVHYGKHDLRVASVSTELPKYDHTHLWTFRQKVYANGHFHVIMSISEHIIRTIGSEMLQREVTTVDNTVVDAISELVTVFTGKACANLNEKGISLRITPPTVTHGVRTYPAKPNKVVALNMETMKDFLTLVFAFTDTP